MSIESGKIKIFPCVSRTYSEDEIDIKAKLMSEENITNILKSITDNKSYVISYESGNESGKLKFVLNGYYIELTYEFNDSDTYYAILNYPPDYNSHKIILGDNGNDFAGISLVNSKPDSGEYLCVWRDGSVPAESYCKFKANSMSFDDATMDFGELK